jgi:hypothetical protein
MSTPRPRTGEDILREIEAEFASLRLAVWEDTRPEDVRPGVIYVTRAWVQAREQGRAA